MQDWNRERSACGVGFLASLRGVWSHEHLQHGLRALSCVEHRGACGADQQTGDGAGMMTDIPYELMGFEEGDIAVAMLFLPSESGRRHTAQHVFEDTFGFLGLDVIRYRDVPVDPSVLGADARAKMPLIRQAFIRRPVHCRTAYSFDKLLYTAKRTTRLKEHERGIKEDFFFASLSAKTIVYKALARSEDLGRFYLDLKDPSYKTRFALFHRRFSTNTSSSWDKVQPFRLIGHNGEINTIAGNRAWGRAREMSLEAQAGELLTPEAISDSGSLNEMVEALRYRSGVPHVEDILALMIPPADQENEFYTFWSRAMEPWDGPAFVTFSEGRHVGARLDRNGFRPCRWVRTSEHFYLASEAGVFQIDEKDALAKGTLAAGRGVVVDLENGAVMFRDPGLSIEHRGARYDARLVPLPSSGTLGDVAPSTLDVPTEPSIAPVSLFEEPTGEALQASVASMQGGFTGTQFSVEASRNLISKAGLFLYNEEDIRVILGPMVESGKEPIGSMGDTARMALLSREHRSLFDYFYQNFSQVTNPPLDYIREAMVTNLEVYLGRKPNIFQPKELIPPAPAFRLQSPVMSLEQMGALASLLDRELPETRLAPYALDTTFLREHGAVGMKERLHQLGKDAVTSARRGYSIIILTDRGADSEHLPIPSLLALRAVLVALGEAGLRLRVSIVVDTGEARGTHHIASLVSFGATAVCPYLALAFARDGMGMRNLPEEADVREEHLRHALEMGLMKVMAKCGISVVRSYQGSMLMTPLGLGPALLRTYFDGMPSLVGGVELEDIARDTLDYSAEWTAEGTSWKPPKLYLYKEHNRGQVGEKHSMTNSRSKLLHQIARHEGDDSEKMEIYEEYLRVGEADAPVNIRHLLKLRGKEEPLALEEVEPWREITRRMGSGAMSFGAISAESQRDIILAMREVGGRSNSGEGGENPFYFTEGITASAKQVASARFGVTAEYLVSGEELQIKVCQGAKPGEGGQLMGLKVTADIAKARFAPPGVDLISPPPLHDIYSIEDLKQLIYELKQIAPHAPVGVKLVSGPGIGTIAVGVAKAGADIIQVSGGDGGTGAASLSSMKHAGLPWELGVLEVHQALAANQLREHVILRADGGLSTGLDIVMAAILGADEMDFGKLLLIAEGCVMARICEKNTCPTGIATHDPRFKAKYKGQKEHIVRVLQVMAEDVRRILASVGVRSLGEIIGRTDLLDVDERRATLIKERRIELGFFFSPFVSGGCSWASSHAAGQGLASKELLRSFAQQREQAPYADGNSVSLLNAEILERVTPLIEAGKPVDESFSILSTDRAVLARFAGWVAQRQQEVRALVRSGQSATSILRAPIRLLFQGSAGQGFGVFLAGDVQVVLEGEANDSVCKGMSQGEVVIKPSKDASLIPEESTIIGNCALYGATGGKLFVYGRAGDRFAVRNSGSIAVVEGTGLHACEYMTNGKIVILDRCSANLGAGMTGGEVIGTAALRAVAHPDFLVETPMERDELQSLKTLLEEYFEATGSKNAKRLLDAWSWQEPPLCRFLPKALEQLRSQGQAA
ncbi:MAG: glutamate synthase large subunit [Myxococcales bacterium]|nr:glutamate synthase large subunit [Myxococcales bacterium]